MSTSICVECNSPMVAEAEFCPECGFPVTSLQPVTCPVCNNLVVFSADGCPVCGGIDSGIPAEAVAVPETVDVPVDADEPEIILPETHGQESALSQFPEKNPAEEDAEFPVEDVALDTVAEGAVAPELAPEAQLQPVPEQADVAGMVQAALHEMQTVQSGMKQELQDHQQQVFALLHEMESTLLTGMQGALSALADAQQAAIADINKAMKQGQTSDPQNKPIEKASAGESSEYLLYLAIAILVFTVLNTLVIAYAVRVVRSGG